MSRLLRWPRTAFPSPRLISQVPAGQTVILQRVRLTKRFNYRTLVRRVGFTILCYEIYAHAVFRPLARSAEDLVDDEAEEDEPTFWPFPFTTRTVQPPPYAGSDPEWQQFIKVARDNKLQVKMREDLAQLVRTVVANNALLARFGKDMTVRRWWLDVDYPFKPPPLFYRSGLLFTDEHMEWTSQEVDFQTVARTSRILYPKLLLQAAMAFTSAFLKQNLDLAATKLGFNPPSSFFTKSQPAPLQSPGTGPNLQAETNKTVAQVRRQATRRPSDVKDPRVVAGQQHNAHGGGRTSKPQNASLGPPDAQPKEIDQNSSPAEKFPGHQRILSVVSQPWHDFRNKIMPALRPARELPPRGCVFVSGLVEIEAVRANIVIEAYGWWNPKTERYEESSIGMALRRVNHKQQAPLR